jgi:hypothetical protein
MPRGQGSSTSRRGGQAFCALLPAVLIALLAACAPAPGRSAFAGDCIPPRRGTATPRVAEPTVTGVAATATVAVPPCPTPSASPRPTDYLPEPRPGLGTRSTVTRGVTSSPGDETLLAVAAGEGQAGVVYHDASGRLFVAIAGDWGPVAVGRGTHAALAFGPGQVALVKSGGAGAYVRIAAQASALRDAEEHALPRPSSEDLAAHYGSEGWLYVATGGQVQRLNPFGGVWEPQATYAGAARELLRTETGVLLLHTSAGIYRRDQAGAWRMTWPGAADGLAALGERAALAWRDGNAWWLSTSDDAGATWSTPELVWRPAAGDVQAAYPLLAFDGVVEVAGVYVEPARGDGSTRYAFPVVVERTTGGWFPQADGHPEPITQQVADLRPTRTLLAVSEQAITLVAWEGAGFNGRTDVFAISR